ncbi:dehydrogenase [Lithospermum erythrorhizon]|uniref:Dehydrogenase n=1 Tax=Lithospermum erythrorhizon TaxID=34254 RepID=A0AAV3QVQ5_LITER
MCRGFQQNDRERLKIKAFYINISVSRTHVADSLTLHVLPRINGSALEVNGSSIRPDSPAFITLHRVVSPEKTSKGVIYGSREKVKGSEGLRFLIYMDDVKVLKGIFRKSEGQKWNLECASELEGDDIVVKHAEISVAVEDINEGIMISEKVDMKVRQRRKNNGKCVKFLEEIPEEREGENEFESEGCCCCECVGEVETDGEDEEGEMEAEMEGVRWAVDVGMWVVCLGVGYFVTKASSRRLRRRKGLI